MGAAVTGAAWNGAVAGFALADGCVALARAEWDGAPQVTQGERGLEVQPAQAPPPPVIRQQVHGGACLTIAASPSGGFVSGGEDGMLTSSAADGLVGASTRLSGQWVDLVACGKAGWIAAAAGRQVYLDGPSAAVLDLPAVATALAFDPAGTRLAVAYYHGVTVWSADAAPQMLVTTGFPRSVAWSRDGAHVICGLQESVLQVWHLADATDVQTGGYSGQPRSLDVSADGRFVASSGGARVACWPLQPPVAGQGPVECGLPASRMPVCRVACHPSLPLVAAGYQNGAVLLCQPGAEQVLFARDARPGPESDPGAGAISALAWSDDGARLAMATKDGEIGVVNLPPRLFRHPVVTPSPRMAS